MRELKVRQHEERMELRRRADIVKRLELAEDALRGMSYRDAESALLMVTRLRQSLARVRDE